ncbi:unnamed protein product [Mytilus coruscus]|uniref:PiggyBac transposable element-derived protein domain-containing protein n=1 Tax=Mytilus coruscus TaxID=42192 RepID=A0A6J8CLS7_MYTCO|nr:unnamed protein product [Mytilus coruscus]
MKGFMSVILNMGLIRKPSITEYWNTNFPSQDTVWFRNIFSRNRFQSILKNFHVVDNTTLPNRNDDNYSPTSKFQCFVDLFNQQSKQHYKPKQNLSIDESLIASKGRSSIIQYIPSKAAKFGVKLRVLAEAVSGKMKVFISDKEEFFFVHIKNGMVESPLDSYPLFSKAAQENDKPAMICSAYNKFMGGVDLTDMMTESYNDGRKTLKVWKKGCF